MKIDMSIAKQIARRPEVIQAAAEVGAPPLQFVLQTLNTGVMPGLASLGFALSDVLGLYQQYQQAKAAGTPPPAPVTIVHAPAAATAATPWYEKMSVLIPGLAGLGILAAVMVKKRRK
jgi:hypothetical protein